MRRQLALFVPLAAALLWAARPAAAAEPFPKPQVSVVVSTAAAGAHPDLRTTIGTPTGLAFQQVTITSPAGGSVAADADIADGTIVGRLDAKSTTNGGAGAACSTPVSFTVPNRKETANVASPEYPAYLRTVAPGAHRLRLVADVSPSPHVPLLVNYLFDIDPATNAAVMRAVVGDPTAAPTTFTFCTPQTSTTTLFGVTPSGAPLLTSPAVPGARTFAFAFTSSPDANGVRYTQTVQATATVGPVQYARLAAPTPAAAAAPPSRTIIASVPLQAPSAGSGPRGARLPVWPLATVAMLGAALAAAGITKRRTGGMK
ncbi:MAG: hypothetical protein KGK07_03225 [Chloroflexota bacterium]|nr:hypothetical protein [Chloroflexota bacterium]